MQRPRAVLLGLTLLILALPGRDAVAKDFLVYALKVSLPVQIVVGNQIVSRTLKEKDIVNLALGRPLATKVDKKTEVLAVAVSPDFVGSAIVVNPSQNGLAQVTTTLVTPTTLDIANAYLASNEQGFGTASGTVQVTTLGNPALNALLSSTISASAAGKLSGASKVAVKGSVAGRISFRVTENGQTRTLAGFVVNGKAKVAGAPIGLFDDGIE